MKQLQTPLISVASSTSGRTLDIPAILPGPMEGIMSRVFCEAVKELSLNQAWITPFIRIAASIPGKSVLKKFIEPFTASGLPVIVQLLGSNPEKLRITAEALLEFDIAGIDMNFACPSKRVVQHDGGGALLVEPGIMYKILSELRECCKDVSLSAKIRTGYRSPNEMDMIIPPVCDAGIDFLSVHYRTVTENYKQSPQRLERMERAVKLSKVPVIGSGNVFTVDDARELCDKCGCSGVMGARGWLRDPLLLKRISAEASSGENIPQETDYRMKFFAKLCELARRNPEQYWSRGWFMEIAVHMWGAKSREFTFMKRLPDADIMAANFVQT